MRILFASMILRVIPGARGIIRREARIIEGMLIFLQQQREQLSESRVLCADRNLYIMGLEDDLTSILDFHRYLLWRTWRETT